jgi:hypothetical protein
MASIGEKIKRALIKEDPQVSKEVVQDTTNVGAQIPVSSMGSISSSFAPTSTIEQSTSSPTAVADKNIIDRIWNAIVAQNRPGPDYLELKTTLQSLDSLPITLEQKISAAFNVLKGQYPNFDKNAILQAIDFYLGVVETEKQTGLGELDKLEHEKVSSVETEITEMQTRAQQMKAEYDALMEQIGEKNMAMQAAKVEINNNRMMFNASIQSVLDVLNTDRQKIESLTI